MEPGVLTQSEIDALLANMPTAREGGSAANKSVRPFDFRRPDRFSKEQIDALRLLHEALARPFGQSLSAELRCLVQVSLRSVSQLAFVDFVHRSPAVVFVNPVLLPPLPGRLLIAVDVRTVLALIDRLLGGPGQPPAQRRPLTDVEAALGRRLVGRLLHDLQRGWSSLAQVEPALGEAVTNPHLLRPASSNEMLLMIDYEVKLGEQMGDFAILVPHSTVEPFIAMLSGETARAQRQADGRVKVRVRPGQALLGVEVPVRVRLGTATVLVRDLLGLQAGDVVRLDTTVDDELSLVIGGRARFLARSGLRNSRLAVEIVKTLGEEPALLEQSENGGGRSD